MSNENVHKKFTANGDRDAEQLLEKVLAEMRDALSGTELCVVLGGSYGRGDGGVRQDKEHGVLYNDLDFFVFARRKNASGRELLKKLAEKVRFSDPMSHDILGELESRISDKVEEMKTVTDKKVLIEEVTTLLTERNKKCKILK